MTTLITAVKETNHIQDKEEFIQSSQSLNTLLLYLLYRLHWLPVSFRIEYKVLILTYKAIHGLAPPYISDLIRTRERTNYNLRSSSQLLLQPYNVTKTKKTLGDRAFQVASPGLWNSLPNDIRNAKTMDVFKSLVKTYLFRKAYACYF